MMEAYAPLGENFAQYTPALITPAADMDVVDDWYVYWALGKRLGLQLNFAGTDLDMVNAPTTDDLLTLLAQRSQVPYDEVKRHAGGAIFERPVQTVLPPRDGKTARFDLAPLDVQGEINALFELPAMAAPYMHKLICRRQREMMNTADHTLAGVRRRMAFNPAHIHGDDLAALGLSDGAEIEIQSATGAITAIVKADASVRCGVISMTHGWGGVPGRDTSYCDVGSSTSQLVATDRQRESINAMPLMSAIPVRIVARAVPGVEATAAVAP